mmetsp:Transcript_2908/g.9521  ORF Transcript_2908/g.9521 Transcript_2908/m.9521 type:complete len:485 (-) Transcript_2908:90-1544(-)
MGPRLGEVVRRRVVPLEPHEALGAQQARPHVRAARRGAEALGLRLRPLALPDGLQERGELLRAEGAAAAVHEGGDAEALRRPGGLGPLVAVVMGVASVVCLAALAARLLHRRLLVAVGVAVRVAVLVRVVPLRAPRGHGGHAVPHELHGGLVVHHLIAHGHRLRGLPIGRVRPVAGRQHVGERHLAVGGVHDGRVPVKLGDEGAHVIGVLLAHKVELVEHHHVRRLHLLHEQVDHLAARGGLDGRGRRGVRQLCSEALLRRRGRGRLHEVLPLAELLDAVHLLRKRGRVHDGHHARQAHHVGDLIAHVSCLLERIAHEPGLGDARRLDDDVVVALLVDVGEGYELAQGGEELVAGVAADAAVLQLDHVHLIARAGRRAVRAALLSDEFRVHVHGGHVVHKDTAAHALLVLEDVLEQRRLARPEEAREDGHRRRVVLLLLEPRLRLHGRLRRREHADGGARERCVGQGRERVLQCPAAVRRLDAG